METKYIVLFFLMFAPLLQAQNINFDVTNRFSKNTERSYKFNLTTQADTNDQPKSDAKIEKTSDSINTMPVNLDSTKANNNKGLIDSTMYDKYGYLLNDDPKYNKKSPIWRPILGTILGNFVTCAFNKYILNSGFCNISFQSVKNNWNNGWEWDTDRFGINFFAHPYSGALGFNHGRSEGYNFWESVPFAFGSSLMWEQTMENTRPSYNDLINTTLTGALEGEIFYRLSSCFLDDRLVGSKRVFREIIAGIIDPVRFVNRLENGKLTRVTNKDIYQREPLQASLFVGVRNLNNGTGFWNGDNSAEIALNFSYGDPLEVRNRKPYDYFTFRGGLSIGAGSKFINNLMGYGLLFGKNIATKNTGLLYGVFQNYDYWDNDVDELGTLGFGFGAIHRVNLSKTSDITSHIHLGVVPMGGIKTPYDSVGDRNYNYVGGLEGILETSVNVEGWLNISASYFLYGLHVYVGDSGNYIVGMFRPRVAVKVYKSVFIGFEFMQYGKDGYLNHLPDVHVRNNEQRIFISLSGGYFGI